MSDFVDRVVVHVRGGDGGNGSAGVRREKYKPLAGPNGGNGGDGGSVVFVADPRITSLLDYRYVPHRRAGDGTMGRGDTKDGSNGEDLVLPVPVGTVVFEAAPDGAQGHGHGPQLADLRREGDRFVAAAGGAGGLGNAALANRMRRAPGFALLGETGEERDIVLELKSIADVALVGFPSAGKSSLIAAMSAARPKIADYPFTTLVPNLGVVSAGEMRFTVADVPGLIPGAAQGKGLGLEFLRHIERTEVIAHVIDCATLESGRDPMSDYRAIEHELAQYAARLDLPLGVIPIPERPRVIILTKIDIPDARALADLVRPDFVALGLTVFAVSTVTHEGLKELGYALGTLVGRLRHEVELRERQAEEDRVVVRPLDSPSTRRRVPAADGPDFRIERKGRTDAPSYVVIGEKPERWVRQTNFDNDEAVGYLADRLARLGVEDELRRQGARPGDEVVIGRGRDAVAFDWDPTIAAGAELLDGSQLGARGRDLRLEETDDRAHRRTNTERRREYHEMMDARAAVRQALDAERKAGHWADPSVDDDPHDEQAILGRGGDADSVTDGSAGESSEGNGPADSPARDDASDDAQDVAPRKDAPGRDGGK